MTDAAAGALPGAHSPALAHWLRLLWGRLPAVRLAPAEVGPFIAQGHIHLPAAAHWHAQRAAAAHAAAHRVYSPPAFDVQGLVPIARMVLALLEDARVEALAMRELPGLAALWRPLHTATPHSGDGFEPLMQRLARALIDPDYDDPHAWVRLGRRLFYLDEALRLPALRTATELRRAALVLGHTIGQMRLPFNARGYRAAPAYRDDHRWMWPADQLAPVAPPPAPRPEPGALATPPDAPPPAGVTITRLPEWDRLARRLRPDWVTVHEQPPGPASSAAPPDGVPDPLPAAPSARRLLRPLRALVQASGAPALDHDGDRLDLDAALAWQLARRAGRSAQGRLFRSRPRQGGRAALWLLVDQSASSADLVAGGNAAPPGVRGDGPRLMDVAAQAASATAAALQQLGIACAVSGFASHGRHALRLHTLKALHQPMPPDLPAQLQALRCGGSTRLGAALRHAARQLATWRAGPRWVLLLSDAQAHDIDVHDPLYLRADARHAVRAAARGGVRMACLTLVAAGGQGAAAAATQGARLIFGPRQAQPLGTLQALPAALQRLLG